MNQDFGLSLTPANARRLLRFRETFNIQLLNDLSELAQQERITETDFDPLVCPCNETRLTVTQFLLDCKLRGVVQQNFNREFDETALLHAIHLTKPSAITIIAKNKIVWRLALRCFGLERISEIHTGLSAETVTRRRASVLIYNVGDDDIGRPLYNHANEFAQFIVFELLRDSTTLIPWTLWAHMLFPTMPTPFVRPYGASDSHGLVQYPALQVCTLLQRLSVPGTDRTDRPSPTAGSCPQYAVASV